MKKELTIEKIRLKYWIFDICKVTTSRIPYLYTYFIIVNCWNIPLLQKDMPVLRKWWCTVLGENFHLDAYVLFFFKYEYTPQPQYELNMYNSFNNFSLFIQARQKVRTFHRGGQTNGGWTTSTSLQTEAKKRSE